MSFKDYDEFEMSQAGQPPEGFVPEEVQDTLDKARDWLELVVHHIYETGDINELEYALEELCAHMEIELPCAMPKVQSRIGPTELLAQLVTPFCKGSYDNI